MRFLFAAGGTGGHVSPAVAMAECLRKKQRDSEILFIGRGGGDECKAITKAGFKLETINVRGLKRSLSPQNLKGVFLALKAFEQSGRLIREFKPDAVIGTGGYVCWPVISAAARMRIPTIIHESNAIPGLVTKLCAKKCTKVLLNRTETASKLKGNTNCVRVGNPIRQDFYTVTRNESRASLGLRGGDILIVSYGGSGGAEVFNKVLIDFMGSYSAKQRCIKHIHATGKRFFEKYNDNTKSIKGDGCLVLPYIDSMPLYLCAADIVITRCGALTLSEISAVGTCAILVPSPYVTNDHQRKNALEYSARGAAIVIDENELSVGLLTKEVTTLVNEPALRLRYAKCIEKFAIRDATEKAVREILAVTKNNN